MKRGLDILLSLFALVALSPLLLAVAAMVRMRLGRPILFRQTRPGHYGRPFEITKFRTMTNDASGACGSLPDAARLPEFGRRLRAFSLDELPELWNVLKGDMSLVGPRPLLMEYLPLYSHQQARRHELRPGMTGWAQVNGRNALSWDEKFRLDVWYIDNHSVLLDIKILIMTVVKVVRSDDVSHAEHATMEKFTGAMK